MLVEFSVKNFLSFRDEVTLSMEKGIGDEAIENVFKCSDVDLLKIAAIYGANASGKSNLLKAFTTAIMMVRNSNVIPVDGKWMFLKPFLFDSENKNKPSEFKFVFMINKTKYVYKFSADINKIHTESLDVYYSQKPTNIFSRIKTNEYTYNKNDKIMLESIESRNTNNKLFLATATTWNYEKTRDVFLWFSKSIDVHNSFEEIADYDLIEYSNNEKELKDFSLKLLRESDIDIKDINVDYEEKEMDSTMVDMFIPPLARTNQNYKVKNVKIEIEHEVRDANNNINTYKLDFYDESSGTRALFALAPFLKRAFEKEKIIIVDELERSLHPSLIEFIIKLFNSKKINKVNSQLIFTTHATNLLNLELLRRDQIWFTEKNSANGVSDLYPLDSFAVRKDENIQKGYINGRYGAIPFIKDVDLWLDHK